MSFVAWSNDGKCLLGGERAYQFEGSRLLGDSIPVSSSEYFPDAVSRMYYVRAVWRPCEDKIAIAFRREIKIVSGKDFEVLSRWPSDVNIRRLAFSPDGRSLATAGFGGLEILDFDSRHRTRIEGHHGAVYCVAFTPDGRILASESDDNTVRFWKAETWEPLTTLAETSGASYIGGGLAFHPTKPLLATLGRNSTVVRIWRFDADAILRNAPGVRPIRYTCAKVVLVGESDVGKSCLAMRLAEHRYPEDHEQGTTHGMRFWRLEPEKLHASLAAPSGERRDVVLWDFGGQEEYRLVHQLFLHDTTIALVLLDPTRDGAFAEVEAWNKRLDKQLRGQPVVKVLVGAKMDAPSPLVDRAKLDSLVRRCGFAAYVETSARTARGVDHADDEREPLRALVARAIDWGALGFTSRPALFQCVRDEVERRRAAGEVVVFVDELQRSVAALSAGDFDGGAVDAVVAQLALQGLVAEAQAATGERAIVLRVDVVERYAGSLIVAARNSSHGVPAIEERVLGTSAQPLPGLDEATRLPRANERIVLECVAELLVKSGVCFRHERLLVFPTLFRQSEDSDAPEIGHSISLFYDFSGAIDNVYASLVASLVLGGEFGRARLWHDVAEFSLPGKGTCGIRKIDRGRGLAHLDVFFHADTPAETRDVFVGLVELHLRRHDIELVEHVELVCPKCRYRVPEDVLQRRIALGESDVGCSACDFRMPLAAALARDRPRAPGAAERAIAVRTRIEKAVEKARADEVAAMKSSVFGRPDERPDEALPLRILHISDLHFGPGADVEAALQPLIADLRDRADGFDAKRLDYLVISGDLTNRATEAEFESARAFTSALIDAFDLNAQRCILVPGNHDQSWDPLPYDYVVRRGDPPKSLVEGRFVAESRGWLVRNDARYLERFRNFSDGYLHKLVQRPYPREPAEQGLVYTYPDDGLQFVSLNSSWEIDEHFQGRASVHPGAVSRAIATADRDRDGRDLLRFAVWHHPIAGTETMQDLAFVEQLRKADVKIALHGHVHERRAELVAHVEERKLHVIGAGTFGARDRPASAPYLYNLIEVRRDRQHVRVHTRSKERDGGAWGPYAVWPGDRPGEKRSWYVIDLGSQRTTRRG